MSCRYTSLTICSPVLFTAYCFVRCWKTSAVSTTDWMVESQQSASCVVHQACSLDMLFFKKLKNVNCEYDRLNGWNSTLQAAWYIRHVRIIWFLWTKPTIWLLILSFTQNIVRACSMFHPYEGYRSVTPLDAARVNRTIFHNHSVHWYYIEKPCTHPGNSREVKKARWPHTCSRPCAFEEKKSKKKKSRKNPPHPKHITKSTAARPPRATQDVMRWNMSHALAHTLPIP